MPDFAEIFSFFRSKRRERTLDDELTDEEDTEE